MLIATHRVKRVVLIEIYGVKLYAQVHIRSEAICSLLYME